MIVIVVTRGHDGRSPASEKWALIVCTIAIVPDISCRKPCFYFHQLAQHLAWPRLGYNYPPPDTSSGLLLISRLSQRLFGFHGHKDQSSDQLSIRTLTAAPVSTSLFSSGIIYTSECWLSVEKVESKSGGCVYPVLWHEPDHLSPVTVKSKTSPACAERNSCCGEE